MKDRDRKRVMPIWYYGMDKFAEEENAEVEDAGKDDAVENNVGDRYAGYAAFFLHYAGREFTKNYLQNDFASSFTIPRWSIN